MLLSLLSDQLPELVQAVWQVVVQPEHHPEFLDPVPGGQKIYSVHFYETSYLKWICVLPLKLTW